MARLVRLRFAAVYNDGFIKCQAWDTEFIQETCSLVFSRALMKTAERKEFLPKRDWRDNPCLVRYRVRGLRPQLICQRGEEGQKSRGSRQRGRALGIEFLVEDNDGKAQAYHCDENWIGNTAALKFQHDLQEQGQLVEPVITHITLQDVVSILDIPKTGIRGELPYSTISADEPDLSPCGFPPFRITNWV